MNLRTLTTTTALLICAAAPAAQAATFTFEFFDDVLQEPATPDFDGNATAVVETAIGTGTLSYDGDPMSGQFALNTLSGLAMSFMIGDVTWTEQDDVSLGNVYWSVLDQGTYFSGGFLADTLMAAQSTTPQAEPFCADNSGSLTLLNDETCFTASLYSDGNGGGFVLYAADMMIETQGVLAMADPNYGYYTAQTTPSPVPVPATLPLLALGLGGLGVIRSRRS